jgi:vitamin B12 transporter
MNAHASALIALRHLFLSVAWVAGALPAAPLLADSDTLEQVVITATSRPESRDRLTQTVQVIDAKQLSRSTARSLTELLAEQSTAFFSTWTPAQTSINLRGAASDGQGKDFRGQVLVLLDGRRAGTANLSKLSPADIARIEIVRGPASVVHGSQSLGGVINLITHDGRSQQGVQLALGTGSWDLAQGQLRAGWRVRRIAQRLRIGDRHRDGQHVLAPLGFLAARRPSVDGGAAYRAQPKGRWRLGRGVSWLWRQCVQPR